MLPRLFLLVNLVLLGHWAGAQQDSLRQDTVVRQTVAPRRQPQRPRNPVAKPKPGLQDSLQRILDSGAAFGIDSLAQAARDTNFVPPPLVQRLRFDSVLLSRHPFYKFKNPVRRMESVRVRSNGKEDLFYCSLGLLLFFALIRNGFSRYLQDLVRLFFRSSLKQRQAKEQLMEAYLPSLLLNLLFIISGSLFLSLVLRQWKLGLNYNFWMLLVYCGIGLASIYFVKFLTLKICGWIFRVMEATDTYTFIVFTTNKVVGIMLIPFIILLAFTTGGMSQVALTLSVILLGGLFLYRYFLSYLSIRRQLKLNFFHFTLYLLAFEVLPLLLINKLLLQFLG
jgi:hypothetical protein